MPESGSLRPGDMPITMPYLPQLDGVRALAILIVFALAALLILPAIALLYVLSQRSLLE